MLYSSLVFLLFVLFAATVVLGKKGYGPDSQEYGYVEVRKGAHMFYWLYYKNTVPEDEAVNAPLVIWLQGGPGGSSTGFGNFIEIGTLDTDLKNREFAWTKYVNMLFIDNPVGTGFSYVEDDSLYTKNNHEIALDLMTFIKEFYKKYQKFEKTPLYIFSQSYGGKMAIEFAYELYKDIKNDNLNINFKGVALGDAWISPIDSCLTWAPYLLNLGVVDNIGFHKIDKVAQDVKRLVDSGKWEEATDGWSKLEDTISEITYDVDFYNVLLENSDNMTANNGSNNSTSFGMNFSKNLGNKEDSLKDIMDEVKTTLNEVIPSSVSWGSQKRSVSNYLNGDFMRPVTNIVEKVLNETDLQVVVYSGQLDLIVDTPGTLNWVERLKWPDAEEWNSANRTQLMVDNRKEGFIKKYNKFEFYWINRAGHLMPDDNPEGAKEMLRQVTQYDK